MFENLIKDPWFAFSLSIFSIVAGILCSAFYYGKGQKDGQKESRKYQDALEKANSKIIQLERKLNESDSKINELVAQATKHDIDHEMMYEVMHTKAYDTTSGDKAISREFLQLYAKREFAKAEAFFLAKMDEITSTALKSYFEGAIFL